ncbi:MAG: phenylalanine--tRNA ligase subunit beta [Rhodospirillaceae bacterium]|nr:phenylalanine--tRNA ligase subunit beta [Rhodospirillaceae bacterium]
MKFTLSWLREHLETDAPLNEIAAKLTAIGLEVEGVEDKAAELAPFRIARVVEARQHPDADRLSVCIVDTGEDRVQVVCGAPNARTGMKGVFAPAGTHIPGTGLDLKKGVIRGQESNGMLCSEREMGLSDEHEGIIDLPDDAPVGEPFADWLGLNDPVIEVAITPNRQDALGVHGIARDLAAAGVGRLKPFDAATVPGTFDSPLVWRRDLPAGLDGACPFVVGRFFRGVTNGSSPEWVQRRLRAIGLRPISALVDITNLVTHDLGRPLHVFDADKLASDLTMRMARDGETIQALDGVKYTLTSDMTVIADDRAVHAIGGLMGGEETGCQPGTTNVFLEVALFDTLRTAATGRKLGLNSDARYRFERGVDPESALWGAEVAARLILEFCGGEVSHVFSAGAVPDWRRDVRFRPARLESLGGLAVPDAQIECILEAQGYTVREKASANGEACWTVAIPSWRVFDVDAHGEADIVEDVLRVYGYDRIPAVSVVPEGITTRTVTPDQRRLGMARRALAARGMLEAVTWSFMDAGHAGLFGGATPQTMLENPITTDLDVMRPSILPNLIRAAQWNADRSSPDVALFEIGPQFAGNEPEDQAIVAAGLRAGDRNGRPWFEAPRAADAFDAKADALAALDAAGAPVGSLQAAAEAPGWYHPGRSGVLKLGNRVLAAFGELHPRILRALDAKGPMVGFEVFFHALPPRKDKGTRARALLDPSPFHPVERDFAFVLDRSTPSEKVIRAAKNAEKKLVADVSVFDVYEGAGIEKDRKSVAISVTLQPTEKTLTDAEIDAVAEKIVAAVQKQTGGELRG